MFYGCVLRPSLAVIDMDKDCKKKEKMISVALCTYNGATYLQGQLDSIASQSLFPDELIVCDDKSNDETMKILSKFASSAPFFVRVEQNRHNLGAKMNFAQAISLCQGHYVALCDQDDVWLSKKLEILLSKMHKAESQYGKQTPILIHTDLRVVDSDCKLLASSFLKLNRIKHVENNPLRTLVVQNFVTGCTAIINRSLINVSLPIPRDAIIHDWWIALVAACRGRIVFVPEATVLYRQHRSNVVGTKGFFSLHNFLRLMALEQLDVSIGRLFMQNFALQKHLANLPGGKTPALLDEYLKAARKSGVAALRATVANGIAKHGIIRNLIHYCLLVGGGYMNHVRKQSDSC